MDIMNAHDQAIATSARLTQTHRVVRILSDLASFVGVDLPHEEITRLPGWVQAVADQAEIAVLNDEHTMGDAIGRLDARFKTSGLDHQNACEVLRHVRAEVGEVERAFADFGMSDDDATRAHALTEIGDAMLLLARLAMRLGASPLEPLRLTIRKSTARLAMFESMGESRITDPKGAWRMAKLMVTARRA